MQKRPENAVNPNMSTGSIEIKGDHLYLLNKAIDLPFSVPLFTSSHRSTTGSFQKTRFSPSIVI